MDFLNNITNTTIIITSNKLGILKEISKLNKLIDIKVMSTVEFRKKYYFDYNDKSVYYLMNKYGYKYDVALSYLENLIYIEDKDYVNEKLIFLKNLKKELEENNLLIKDKLFFRFIKDKDIIILDSIVSLLDKNMFKEVSKLTNVKYINLLNPKYEHSTLLFDMIDDEIEYVAFKISELIKNGVLVDNIKLTNISENYINSINKIFSFYNLKIDKEINTSIYSTKIGKQFIHNLKSSVEESLESISKYKGTDIYNKIIDLLNDLTFIKDLNKNKNFIISKMKTIFTKNEKIINSIEVVDYNTYYFKDEYVFMMNFNNDSIPKIIKNEEFITDEMCEEVLIEKTNVKNKISKNTTINIIKSIKNLTITSKKRTFFDTYYISNLVSYFPAKKGQKPLNISFSSRYDKIKLASYLDTFMKYGTVNEELKILYGNYKIPYKTYNNRFTGIDASLLKKYLKDKLYLSFTSLDNYSKCSFRYYLTHILKLDIYEEKFGAYLGSLFHYVLEKTLSTSKTEEELIKEFINSQERNLTIKEMFYIDKLKKEIGNLIEFIKRQMDNTELKDLLLEKRITLEKKVNYNVYFNGIIDKVMYKEFDDYIVASLIDYKTYSVDIDLRYIMSGINMQLPVYLYLSKQLFKKEVIFAGFYVEQILNNSVINKSKSLYLLNGYSNSSKDILSLLDKTYENSEFISNMKVKQDGDFYKSSKVLNDKQITNLIKITDKVIDETILKIEQAKFDINPKVIAAKNISCEYCNFKDICYKTENDTVYITGEDDLSFLGGDIDA